MFISFFRKYRSILGPRLACQIYLMQHVLRINGKTPWPVHWTSTVFSADRITFIDSLGGGITLGASPGCYIQANNGIIIGRNVLVGPFVRLISSNHNVNDFSKHDDAPPIIIGDNCWLGSGCAILPGVRLADHVIVGAGSVVTKSFDEPNCVIGGIPAKKIKSINGYMG